jgi:hypothetical protein
MTKITILKNGTILIGKNDLALVHLTAEAMQLHETTIDKQMIVTKDEVVERLEEMLKLIIGGITLICFWIVSVVIFSICLIKDLLEEMKKDKYY